VKLFVQAGGAPFSCAAVNQLFTATLFNAGFPCAKTADEDPTDTAV